MTPEEEEVYRQVKDNTLREYRIYDDQVSCVAAWHFLLTEFAPFAPFTHRFDWFPRKVRCGTHTKTPDFAALLSRGVILGELKSGKFPMEDSEAYHELLSQISAYTRIETFPDRKDVDRPVSNSNVVVLLRSEQAVVYGEKLIAALAKHKQKYVCKSLPVIMSYSFQENVGATNFVLERLPLKGNGEFIRFASEDAKYDLHTYFCSERLPLILPPDRLVNAKVKYRIMNDDPPDVFCAAFLWDHLFHVAISEYDFNPMSISSRAYYRFPVEVNKIWKDLERWWCPEGYHKTFQKQWVIKGLKFLHNAGLVDGEPSPNAVVTVKLQRAIGNKSRSSENLQGPNGDIAEDLSDRYALRVSGTQSKSTNQQQSDAQTLLPLFE